MKARGYWVPGIFVFVAAEALAMQMRGPLLSNFQESFGLSEGLLGLIVPAATVGFLFSILLVGFRAGRIDNKRFLLVGTVGMVAATALISLVPSFGFLLVSFLFQGLAAGVFRAIDRPVLSHLYPTQRGRIFNLYTFVWALGAALAPLFVNRLLRFGDWRLAYLALAPVFAVPFALLVGLDRPAELTNETALSIVSVRDVVSRPAVAGMGFSLVLSGGVEGSLFTWLPFYAEQYFSTPTANLLLSVFFVAYIPARLLYGYVAEWFDYRRFVLALVVATVPAYLFFITSTGRLLIVSVALLGVLISGFFPMLLSFGVEGAPEHSGPVNALGTTGNFVGITVFPFVIGLLTARFGIGAAMHVPLGLVVALAALLLALGRVGAEV